MRDDIRLGYEFSTKTDKYAEVAEWCQKRGATLERIGSDAYRVVSLPEPSPEFLQQEMRNQRDKLLQDTDWRVMRHMERVAMGLEPIEDYAELLKYRQKLRDLPNTENWADGTALTRLGDGQRVE